MGAKRIVGKSASAAKRARGPPSAASGTAVTVAAVPAGPVVPSNYNSQLHAKVAQAIEIICQSEFFAGTATLFVPWVAAVHSCTLWRHGTMDMPGLSMPSRLRLIPVQTRTT